MRITIVNQYYPPDMSPTAHLVASLAEHRARRGDEVTVVTSAARYTADTMLDGVLWAKSLRSPYAHARILNVDVSRAKALPGVHASVRS